MQNHYYNNTHTLRPYTHTLPATPGTIAPLNALRGDVPAVRKGFWPCEKDGAWIQVEDHRERDEAGGFPPELQQEGTPYWLPEDTYGAEARKMKDIGPLPEGVLLAAPEQSFEELYAIKVAEAKAERNARLASTDFMVLPDFPISKENLDLVIEYRQQLRDITKQERFPDLIEWPELHFV